MNTLDKILFLKTLNGLSDNEFAQKTGLYKTVIPEWKSHKTKSYLRHIPAIAKALNVTEEFLLSDAPIQTANTNLQLDDSLQELLINASSLSDESMNLLSTFIDLLHAKETLNKQQVKN